MPAKLMQLNCLYAHDEVQPTPWKSRCAILRRWIQYLDPDIITLEEILVGTRADTGDGVDMLADICAGSCLVHRVFGPACDAVMPFVSDGQQQGVVLGNAIASRWPIEEHALSSQLSWQRATVGRGFAAKRSAIWARIATPYGPMGCACTHLDSVGPHDANRFKQMVEVMAFIRAQHDGAPWPAILTGDMNAKIDSDALRYACGYTINGATAPNAMADALSTVSPDAQQESIDFVLVDAESAAAAQIQSCEVVQDERFGEWPSDHPAIVVHLRGAAGSGKL